MRFQALSLRIHLLSAVRPEGMLIDLEEIVYTVVNNKGNKK